MSGVKHLVTAEDLLKMPEVPGKQFELVDGELVEVSPAGVEHNLIAALIYRLLYAFAEEYRLGIAFTDNLGYILRRDPDLLRAPDVSFVARERLPEGQLPKGFWDLAPDLAVEVVSPGDTAIELRAKVRDYLECGTRIVWVVWPDNHSVTVYDTGGGYRDLAPEDELDGGSVLPGFRVRVADLFDIYPSLE